MMSAGCVWREFLASRPRGRASSVQGRRARDRIFLSPPRWSGGGVWHNPVGERAGDRKNLSHRSDTQDGGASLLAPMGLHFTTGSQRYRKTGEFTGDCVRLDGIGRMVSRSRRSTARRRHDPVIESASARTASGKNRVVGTIVENRVVEIASESKRAIQR